MDRKNVAICGWKFFRRCFIGLLLLIPALAFGDNAWEIMNPETPPDPRFGHSSERCDAETLLMFAGKKADVYLDDLHVFRDNRWVRVEPEGGGPSKRCSHATWTSDGDMYVFGGMGTDRPLHDLWKYDPVNHAWEALSAGAVRPSPRYGHAVAAMADGRVYISGGVDADGKTLADLWVMNPDYTFTQLQSNLYHTSHHKIHVYGDSIFLIGTAGVTSRYSISENRWEQLNVGPPLKGHFVTVEANAQAAEKISSTAKANSQNQVVSLSSETIVYLFGGLMPDGQESDRVYVFRPSDQSWTELAERMPMPLYDSAAAPLDSNRILFFGGISNGVPVNTTMLFYPDTVQDPVPTIRANDIHEETVTLAASDLLSIRIGLNAGNQAGQPADWWLLTYTPFGFWFLDLVHSYSWQAGLDVTFQGPIASFDSLTVLQVSGLPAGSYIFYFGVDMTPNGAVDVDSLYHDWVYVEVTSTE